MTKIFTAKTYTNPAALIEVVTKKSEAYDRGFKAQTYRQIESLRTYLLAAQAAPHIELFERRENGVWNLREVRGLGGTLRVPSLGIGLTMAEVYDRVDFTGPA